MEEALQGTHLPPTFANLLKIRMEATFYISIVRDLFHRWEANFGVESA